MPRWSRRIELALLMFAFLYNTGTSSLGYGRTSHDISSKIIIVEDAKACFRRVLAGKRIAPHWVRRTIACERIEECMRECGYEKRFMCEGFNYRLDPSGQGQGDCELIEIPLSQMDLYSSPNRRDSNMLRHPDYDYYERDRNAPSSCRRNVCQDCLKGPPPPLYDSHPPPSSIGSDYHSGSYEFSSHGSGYFEHTPPSSYGSSGGSTGYGPIDRYDNFRPDDPHSRPSHLDRDRWESIPSSTGYDSAGHRPRPEHDYPERFRPPYRPGPDYSPYRPSSSHDISGPSPAYRPSSTHDISGPSGPSSYYHPRPPLPPPPPTHNYLDHDDKGPPPSSYKKPTKFIPYLIGAEEEHGKYGGSYGGSYNKQSSYWGLSDHNRRKDPIDFNYFELGSTRREPPRGTNSVLTYPGSNYGSYEPDRYRERFDYKHQWTRRPGADECSAKTGEGFRLHKTAVKHSYTVPTLTECERLCSGHDGFICHTYSYRYNQLGRDNCLLCDRPVNMLDYYVDIEPDRDYDIYSMADDLGVCRKPSRSDGPSTALSDPRNAQCFFRAIDATRFFKSIVRDSLTVRSVGECEMECIKSTKFTCRAFAYRYGDKRHSDIIDNCQLSDWPVRDMDKERHLILDTAFDVFERASYGHGCEIQPIADQKNKKLCYLGYGSPAKLLSAAVKKVISVPSELDCKKECIRFRETTAFKCYSFSYGARAKSYNCEMSDLDQTELKLNIHYTHTDSRDYWLFAWNPFDWTCRDKVNSVGGGTRVGSNRRMDVFREQGDLTWRHYTVAGKACRRNSPCEKNLITGFYSCEIEGGEIGSWDYCCKAEHPCGYSQGFDYPWCFVGDESDQWRKCSDRYYPEANLHRNRTQTHSSITASASKESKKKHATSSSPAHSHSIDNSGSSSDEYQHPPRPGGLQSGRKSLNEFTTARLWPVTYLYSEGPPNSTEFSNFVDCNKETC